MDTTEELNGTYFYNGVHNLTNYELLFWILVDETERQLGINDIIGVAGIILGDNSIEVPGKPNTATRGTSPASVFFRKHLRYKFKRNILPTLTKKSFSAQGVKVMWINNLGAFVGRAVPVLGWVILATDITMIAHRTIHRYNLIAKAGDKIW